jgi:hypothetical protein
LLHFRFLSMLPHLTEGGAAEDVGTTEGAVEGAMVGVELGAEEGVTVGAELGAEEGVTVGAELGAEESAMVGAELGIDVVGEGSEVLPPPQ